MNVNGEFHPIKQGFAAYMRRWYEGLVATTPAAEEYVARGIAKAVKMAPGRMIDAAEEMLAAYRKDTNSATPDRGALLPIVMFAISHDFAVMLGDWGRQRGDRFMVRLGDAIDAPVYGYRSAMGDLRVQVAIMAAEEPTARSLAAQFGLFVGSIANRGFYARTVFHGYNVDSRQMIENPDVAFVKVQNDQKNLVILVADLTLKALVPYLDGPEAGYEVVTDVHITNHNSLCETVVSVA